MTAHGWSPSFLDFSIKTQALVYKTTAEPRSTKFQTKDMEFYNVKVFEVRKKQKNKNKSP